MTTPTRATLTLSKRHSRPTVEHAASEIDSAAFLIARYADRMHPDNITIVRERRRVVALLRDLAAALRSTEGKSRP